MPGAHHYDDPTVGTHYDGIIVIAADARGTVSTQVQPDTSHHHAELADNRHASIPRRCECWVMQQHQHAVSMNLKHIGAQFADYDAGDDDDDDVQMGLVDMQEALDDITEGANDKDKSKKGGKKKREKKKGEKKKGEKKKGGGKGGEVGAVMS